MIRAAHVDDAERIAEIHVRSWQAAYEGIFPREYLRGLSVADRLDRWKTYLEADSPATVLVAEDETSMLGWVSVGPSRDADSDGSVGEIYGLYVDPSRWGRGVGGSLWSAASSFATSEGWIRLILWVLKDNTRARRFYERVGLSLEPDQRRPYLRDGHTATSLRYSIRLS